MIAAIKSEFRKLFSTRMWWILAIVMIGYLAFVGILMSIMFTLLGDEMTGGAVQGKTLAVTIYGFINPIGYVFPLLIGSLLFTSEFRHQTITPSLLSGANRTHLLLSKLVVSAVVGLLYGVIAVLAMIGSSAPFLQILGDGHYLGDSEVWKLIAGSLLVFVLWTMFGVALGGLIVNQVAAIVVILAMTQFVEPVLGLVLGIPEATRGVAQFLPAAAGNAVVGSNSLAMGTGMGDMLTRTEGAAVLMAYIVIFALLCRFITLRRDIG
jgi:ABC-2 type transport system permease protein